MQDIINSFKAHLYERTNSPFVGAFIFYWIIYNYKIIVILFDSKLESKNKFIEIDKLYIDDIISIQNFIDIPIDRLLIPLGITLLYILVFPFLSNLIHKGWVWHQNELKKISNGKVLTKKEFGDLQRRFTELELSFDDTFSKKDNEIIGLKQLIESKDSRLDELTSEKNELSNEIIKNESLKKQVTDLKTEKEVLQKHIRMLEENQKVDNNFLNDIPKLTEKEKDLLTAINIQGNPTITQIGEYLHVTKTSIRKTINSLIYKEMLKIDELKVDKDNIKVKLTLIGKRTLILENIEIPF